MESLPFVSILCPSYRPGGLDVLFSGLAAQNYGGPWEVVMVDELYNMTGRQEAVQRAVEQALRTGVNTTVVLSVRHLPNPRSVFPRCSTVTARNEAIVAARGELAIWLVDYAAVRPDFILQHVAAHAEHGFDKKVVINGAIYNVWPPPLQRAIRGGAPFTPEKLAGLSDQSSLFEAPLSASAAWSLPLQNRTHRGAYWTRELLGQDEASINMCEGEVGAGYHFMKHDSLWLETLRAVGGLDEAYLGLHKYDDSDIAARLELYGCRFFHSKRPAIRHIQMRHLLRHLEMPPDAEEKGMTLLNEAKARVAAGVVAPRATHPSLRRGLEGQST